MQIIIHRGTHQIGGIATEIKTESSRILIDMGDELSQEDNYVPQQLSIPGITDSEGICDAVFIAHYHSDHVGQLVNVREDIPIYMGCLAKDIMLATAGNNVGIIKRIEKAHTFLPGVTTLSRTRNERKESTGISETGNDMPDKICRFWNIS